MALAAKPNRSWQQWNQRQDPSEQRNEAGEGRKWRGVITNTDSPE